MASKKSSKKTGSGTRTGTKKTITKTRSQTGKSKSKTRTHTHRSKSGTKTKHTTNTGKSRGTSRTSGTSRSRSRTTIFGESSSIGPGLNDPLLYIFLIILIISIIVLLVVGIWLLASRNGWPHGLNTAGSEGATRFISYGTACIVAGLLLIFAVLFTFLAAAAKTGAAARVTRIVSVFFVSLIFIIFILMIITGIMFAAHKPAYIANIVRDGWSKTAVKGPVDDLCDIQRKYGCQGWYDNQCRTCRPTVDGVYDYTAPPGSSCDNTQRAFCPRCFPPVETLQRDVVSAMDINAGMTPRYMTSRNVSLSTSSTVRSEVIGCRYFVRRRNRTFFIPFTVYIVFLTILLLFLSWKTCLDSSGRR